MIELWLAGVGLSLSLCADLGIVNVALIRVTLQRGLRSGVIFGLGSCFGDMTYATLAAVGMASLLEWEALRWLLWLGGSAILFFLMLKALREIKTAAVPELNTWTPGDLQSQKRILAQGYFLALTSPSSLLWWAAVGGSIIATAAQRPGYEIAGFFFGFFCGGLIWCVTLASFVQQGRKLGKPFVQALHLFSAFLFALMAIWVFWQGWQSLILGR